MSSGNCDDADTGLLSRPVILPTLLLAAAGSLLNMVAPQPIAGVYLLPGGIATMLAVRCLGTLPTLVVAGLVSLWTLALWPHAIGIVTFVAEAAAVSYLHRHRRMDTLVADTLFWLLAAPPLVLLTFRPALSPDGSAEHLFVQLATNGLLSVVLANLLWVFACRRLRLPRPSTSSLSLTSLLFNLLAGFLLLPGLLVVSMAEGGMADQPGFHSIRALETLLAVLLLSMPLGYLAGCWLSGLLGRLSHTLEALGPGLATAGDPGRGVHWPQVGVREIDALSDHVRTMAEALFQALEDRQAGADELRVLAERLQVANRGAGIGVWEWHVDTGRLIFDDQMYEVLGVDRSVTPSYQTWLGRLVPEDRAPTERELRRCLAQEDTFHTEFRVQHPRHGLRFVLGYAVIFRTSDGQASRLVGLNWDITEQRLLQAGLIQSSKLATLGEMATAVAHELNQPLNVIGMAAGNLGRKLSSASPDPAYLAEKVDVIRAQVNRAAAIIDHMRIFGRKAVGAARPIDVAAAVTAATELMNQQLRQARIALWVECTPGVPPVLGHQVQVEQVVLNLLTNARDALGDCARVEGSIHVRVGAVDGIVEIRVEDNAGGIAADHLDRVFEPFFTTKAPGKGTGLGLSVSYGIITDMRGTISVENTVAGAVFIVRLPAAPRGGRR